MNEAVDWTARLLAFSWLLQALEHWRVRRELAVLLPWGIVRREYGVHFDDRAWPWLIALQGVLALALLTPCAWFPWAALALALLQAARFRGSYNGGSDAMTLVVLLGLAIAR
ncbi:MAG TPA: hypothetical protein VFX59_06270, partial [Polyangiales bacterium]|nr:hypothetical protein [Polyangiales bacterium]